mmetsp:Transcript_14752/g.31069  ORF Transcript_14752/g.31069 Transcript_14752/m.31069 type:complete len:247 (-) Transcript_14752:274-1014(-)
MRCSKSSIPLSAIALLVALISAQNFAVVNADGSYSHTVKYGGEECITIRVPKDIHYLSGSFDLLDTKLSPEPARVRLYDSNEHFYWSSPFGATSGSFSQRVSGINYICLENGLTYEQERKWGNNPLPQNEKVDRTIGFSIRIKKAGSLDGRAKPATETDGNKGDKSDIDGTASRLVELTDRLNENFQVLADHMSFMKTREAVHRELHEETFTKVVWWNILEICAVVVVTFGQILNVWYILSNKRSY